VEGQAHDGDVVLSALVSSMSMIPTTKTHDSRRVSRSSRRSRHGNRYFAAHSSTCGIFSFYIVASAMGLYSIQGQVPDHPRSIPQLGKRGGQNDWDAKRTHGILAGMRGVDTGGRSEWGGDLHALPPPPASFVADRCTERSHRWSLNTVFKILCYTLLFITHSSKI